MSANGGTANIEDQAKKAIILTLPQRLTTMLPAAQLRAATKITTKPIKVASLLPLMPINNTPAKAIIRAIICCQRMVSLKNISASKMVNTACN